MFGVSLPRINIAYGKRTLLRQIQPPQNAVSSKIFSADITPDGTGYAYEDGQLSSTLYVVEGIK